MQSELLLNKSEKKIYDILPHEPETMATTLLIIGMAVYYFWRMFAITPQYDELYTYYTFISRGPFYSAIHWPLPNNHVGYSVLSAILDYLGNPYFGLRGVSFFCAVSNLILVYRICKRYFSHGLPLGATFLYASMQVVNEYSVQGRGYTLATTCFLISIYIIGSICRLGENKNYLYVSLVLVLTLGLYTVPSSVYWVIPVGLAGVLFLLINALRSRNVYDNFKDNIYYKKLHGLVLSGIIAALCTVFLYTIIWLAIGSNLLVKDATSELFGLSHGTVLVRAPIKSLMTGINYMLSQPYIQSVPANEFWSRFPGFIMNLLGYMLPGLGGVLVIIIVASLGCLLYECIRHFEYSRTVINLIAISNVLFFLVILIIQKKLPYLRVFSYMGFIVTLCVCAAVERLINVTIRIYNRRIIKKESIDTEGKETEQIMPDDIWYTGIGVYIPLAAMIIIFIVRFFSYDFSCQLGSRENEVFSALYIADVSKRNNPAVIDCDQQYLLKFGWDIDCNKTDVTDADMVIVDKDMFDPDYSGENFWKFYQTYETIDWEYLKTMRILYENEDFVLYVK